MDKDLRQYIAESDDEFKIEITAPYDLHRPYMMDMVRRALNKYEVREFEPGMRRAPEIAPKDFPGVHNAEVTSIKAVIGIRPSTGPRGVALEVSMMTLIPDSLIKVDLDGDEKPEPIDLINPVRSFGGTNNSEKALLRQVDKNHPQLGTLLGDHENDVEADGQEFVGMKRIHELLGELEKSANEAKAASEKITKFVMTHIGLKESTGVSRRKGYYVCEQADDKVQVLEGPFETSPEGLQIRHS